MEHGLSTHSSEEQRRILGGRFRRSGHTAFAVALDGAIADRSFVGAIRLCLRGLPSVNHMYGHMFGNLLIQEIEQYLRRMPHCETFRLSGIDYAILLDADSPTGVAELAAQTLDRFSHPWHIQKTECVCSVAMGYIGRSDRTSGADQLMDNLAYAVEQAKQGGKSRAVFYEGDRGDREARRREIEQQLDRIRAGDPLEIRFRPTAHIPTGRYVRAECLLGLSTPSYGLVHGPDFLPIAEQTGQIESVGRVALEAVCRMVVCFARTGVPFEAVTMPVSASCLTNPFFLDAMVGVMKRTGVPPRLLAFTFPQSVLSSDIRRPMFDISSHGVELALSDFGSGAVNVERLLSLPVSVLKLERTLLWQMESDPGGMEMIGGLIATTKSLGMKLIVEGVDTERQAELLRGYGSEYEQGFYYSPTLTADELQKRLGGPFHHPAL